ncbi:MAG: hypothetical protein P0Y49_04960 [Candidatus Pedobacter colombiensis]|uniref:Uncharacterized protein n=1 Tax=Candidatus Pedobacter colombiensis TaxID=3121371 RepID=A0AAJ5WBD1_9SPHI|nr:hypothetical protein [Pedobacter sp.]WEK20485.1 MAG: hypothetical protein P0Y49_04960 [Pedobacter sp.]
MSNSRLDTLIRKNKGKKLLDKYISMFHLAGFGDNELRYVELKKADEVVARVKEVFQDINQELEILSSESTYQDSKLLMSILTNLNSSYCYVFSDDFYLCGMYQTHIKAAVEHCLNVAKFGYSNTCFILDQDFRYSCTINYYIDGEPSLQNKFDIHLKLA